MTAALDTLNRAAQVALTSCEQRIERALKSFVDIGQALTEIRDGRLYRATHETFDDYCRERWDIGRDYADRMIAGAQVVLTIVSTGLPAPTKESQARELVKVPELERAEVWRTVLQGGKPTAEAIREAARKRAEPPRPAPENHPDPMPGEGRSAALPSPVAPGGESDPAKVAADTTPEPTAAAVSVVGSGSSDRPVPPSAFAVTPEQRAQMEADAERGRAIAHAHKLADRLIQEVSAMVTEIEMGVGYGEPGLFTAEMVTGLRAQADRIESYLEERA